MKPNFLHLLTMIFLIVISFTTPSFGKGNDSLYTIELKDKILIPNNNEPKAYKLELLNGCDVLETEIIVDDESFLLRLQKNSSYTIRISRDNYCPLVVTINTSSLHNINKFSFDNSSFTKVYGLTMSLDWHVNY